MIGTREGGTSLSGQHQPLHAAGALAPAAGAGGGDVSAPPSPPDIANVILAEGESRFDGDAAELTG
ncbi:MAG TPA: hypothetical protein VF605_01490 [Allosphingosinicella sp.]|jgi:hypothetical protein